ncbi:cadherin EGF LAG seven-pass G-type receptor 2-like isoform X2 [Branchiostoma floridae x Branchiostoma japonicum]
MEMPFVWLGGCLYTLLLYFTLSTSSELDVPGSSPYTVHLENSTSVGKAVFDAWLGPGWRYRWVPGPGTHQARRFFSLDPVTGVLSVSRELDCSRLYHNPFTAHIGARTAKIASKHASGRKSASLLSEPRHEEVFVWTDLDAESPGRTLDSVISRTHEDVDYTSIPVELWIHGENCRFRHRKNLNQALQSLGVQTVHLHRHANHHANNAVQNGAAATNLCLSENQLLFSPADYVPTNILQSCQVSYDILNSSLSLGHTGFGIVTSEALCTDEDNPSITVQVMLDLVCDVGSVPMSSQMLLHVMLGRRVQPDFVPVRTLHHMFKFRRKRSSNSFPSFGPSPAFVVQVPENEDPGYVVTLVTATDPDPGEAGRLQYSMVALQNSRSQDLFSIDPASGEVTTQEVLDREDMNRHFFRVTARDNGSPPRSATATLQIDILDMNDHDPEFEENSYREAVLEGIEIGSNVLTVRATDQDIGPNSDIRYSIINPSGTNTAFQISRRDGVITTTEALDRETTASYRLEVRASDQGTPPRTSDVVVTITVLDENDNEPQFEQQSYAKDVPENVRPDTVIQTVAATDPDEGTNSQIRYSLIGGNSQGHFTIDSATGDISVITNLDFEATPRYRLIVKAQDSGRPSMWSSVVLTISVIDVNDHDPQFVSTPFETSVFEDVRVGFSVIHIQAIDADSGSNAELTYSLANVPARMPFEIDGDTGWIVTNAELDREAHAIYDFNVQAADHGSPARTAAARVSINILDVNDNAPVFNPKVYYINVPEDANPGTSVLTVTANDADEVGTVSYQITGGNVRNRFSITSQNGLGTISVALPLDYKQETRFVLTVQATDRMLSDDAQVYINITDANTHRPVFQQSPYSVYVDEDVPIGTTILVVSATDGDEGENARISYSMDILNAFEIEPSTGAIKTKQRLDHEAQASFAVSVTATDHGVPSKFDESYVDIIVNDVNDNAPVFLLESYSGSVREDCSRGTSVTQISATDADSGTNGQIRYTFTGGDNGEDAFVIDERSGIIRTDKRLDRELIPVYNLVAYAEDQGQPEQKTPVDIIVTIEDVNDNAPQFPSDTIDIYVPENRVVGSVVARITANDPDEGQNAEVMYYITKGNNPELFQLDIFSGELVTLIDLDYEARNFYEITVQARSMPLFSEAIVNIHIQDENDNIPVLQDFEIVFNNYRNHFPTDYIGRIPAFDPDVSDRLAYSFTFGNNANLLHLNQSTGEIKLSPQLDSDRAFEAQLGVSVTDGINKVSAQCLLKVSVVTDEMLSNSITVRLGNMTQELFLSPRYNRFVEGLAAILQTPQDHIHIFNVRDDVDVSHKILNVSFSARDPTQIRTVYYTPQYLRERVYLRRTLLNQLTAATVLPFDDNVCLIEPCPNYERCVSVLKFDSTAPFVTSDTVLFRAIHPINGLRCKCPLGFTGSYCETEINLCYSSPCGGNGNCMRKEGGYTCVCNEDYAGDNCEINAREGRCTDYVCKNGGVCTNLLVGGFRCNCGMQGNHVTDFCEVSTRSFPPRSFLTFPALQQRFRMQLSLTFASQNRNALLLYNGRYNVKHDYLALEIVDGQIKFSFSTGQETTVVQPHVPGGVNDGQWHTVTINYMNKPCSADEPCSNIPYGPSDRKVATVSIDDCDTAIAVKYGSVIGNYSCAAQGVQLSGKKSLDLTGPMIMGGLPSLEEQFPVKNRDYVGCIKDFYIDNKFVDLASYMSNNGTTAGCPERQQFCTSNPCRNGGTCENDWDRFYCSCPTGYGGPTCNRQMRAPKRYSGNSVMDYSVSNLPVISLPWYNGLMFRTRQANGLMMRINIGDFNVINLELVNGFLQYRFTLETITMTNRRVNDGDWHAVEVRWTDSGELVVDLDYGGSVNSTTIADWISQLRIRKVNVGGLKQGAGSNIVVENGFRGCIQGVTLGGARDQLDPNTATSHNVEDNCVVDDLCDSSPCPANSFCNDEWESYSCQCDIGYVGRGCVSACELNPCEHGSTCVAMPSASHGYSCECTELYQGQYCEEKIQQPCPSRWWGYPICGPCDCDESKGFDPDCNKTTGECYCKEHHYQPKDSEVCYPCDCYMEGSNSMDCDQETGQCSCGNGVIGRRCDSCHNPFAEVTGRSCEVIYDGCPKSYAEGKWWPQTRFGLTSREECPSGASGIAERQCSEETGWLPPNMFNCTSRNFIPLKTALEGLRGKLSSEQAQNIAQDLRNATVDTPDLYGNDVNISYQLLSRVLEREAQEGGLNLTATQDQDFNNNLVESIGQLLEPKNQDWWNTIQRTHHGTAEMLRLYEKYAETLARNMEDTYSAPFAITVPNVVMAVKAFERDNLTGVAMPQYGDDLFQGSDNELFDSSTNVQLPPSLLGQEEEETNEISRKRRQTGDGTEVERKLVVATLLFKDLGQVMPESYDTSGGLYLPDKPVINSPVLTVAVYDGSENGTDIPVVLLDPVFLEFKLLQGENRSKPQCVYWDFNLPHHNGAGAWTTRGCRLMERNLTHIKCGCDHLSSFAILMDDSPSEFGLNRPVALMVVTYVGIGISLVLLVAAFLTFMCLKNLQSNTNTIHKNLVASIFIAELIFLVGVNATHNQLMCTLVAILLHYSFLTAFAWMFLEALHIYRMLTEIRNINQGHMRFYYSIGWGAPAIIVGLAFGVKPESYGNRDFCWLQVNDRLFWTLAGPILLVVLINLFVFIFAVRRLLRMARKDPEHQSLKSGLMATAILIPMLGTTWVFGVLAVNQDLETFHYMFAILTCMQGLFVFLFHCIFNPSVRQGWSRCWGRCRGKKGTYEDSVTTRTTLMSRSALAYNNTSSADGGLHRINIGTSTNSTGSRSTSKTSTSQLWRTDGMLRTGYNPNDYKPNHPMFLDGKVNKGGEEGDSDSDSDMSLNDPDEELSLASSHSSDDEEYDGQPNWEKTIKLSDLSLEVVMEDAPKSLRPILKSPKSSRSSRSRSSKSSRERRERQMSDEGSESNSDSSAAKELKQILKKPGSRKGIAKSASGNFYSSSSSSDDSESEYEFLQKDPKDVSQNPQTTADMPDMVAESADGKKEAQLGKGEHLKPAVHGPLHSTPKDPVPVNRVPREKPPLMPKPKPKWPGEPLSASERESLGSLDRLKVEPKVNGDKPSPPVSQHGGSIHGSQPDVVRIQPGSREFLTKPLVHNSILNDLRYKPPSRGSSDSGSRGQGSRQTSRDDLDRLPHLHMAIRTNGTMSDHAASDTDGSNETSV